MFEASYSPLIQRYFKKINDAGLKQAFIGIRKEILLDPKSGDDKTADLSGFYTKTVRYKGVQYRVAYRIYDEEKTVYFILAGTRENFYDDLKRYLREQKLL